MKMFTPKTCGYIFEYLGNYYWLNAPEIFAAEILLTEFDSLSAPHAGLQVNHALARH